MREQSSRLRMRGASPLSGSARDAHMGAFYLTPSLRGSCAADPEVVMQFLYKSLPFVGAA